MKFLLTSAGVQNPTIREALVDLLGKPIEDADALYVPTAMYGHPMNTLQGVWRSVSGRSPHPMVELGWKSVGLLELTALPSLPREQWLAWLQNADVLLVGGGDALYLAHWMRESGVAELLPTLDVVWVGMSAGSMVMAPSVGEDFIQWRPAGLEDRALGFVDFAICPHVDHPDLPDNSMAEAARWAATMPCPCYAIDDSTTIRVVDGKVDLVSEGHWKHFPGPAE